MKTEGAAAIPPQRAHALTTSAQFPNDELGSSRKSLAPDPRPYRRKGYFVRSLRRVLDRLRVVAIELASIAILIVGLIIAVFCALDLLDMLRW
jgi:hypothetical protein